MHDRSIILIPPTIVVLLLINALLMWLIWWVGPYSEHINFVADKGATWYFWQRPDPNWLTRLSAWGSFVAHQVFFWWLIYDAKTKKQRGTLNYSHRLQRHNYVALLGNLAFVLWHIIQTSLFYDGLAQDTHVFSGQFAVILLLSLVLVLENKRRGLLFGYRIGWLSNVQYLVKEYHGYYFSWAIIYTFWYHPIEITAGHMLGTFYALMILTQGCLLYTRYHRNRYWTVLIETFVFLHGAVVAYYSVYHNVWSMFAFGFLTMFIITGIYGLGLKRKTIAIITGCYVLGLCVFYRTDITAMSEVVRIPIILLLVAIVLGALLYPVTHRNVTAKKQLKGE
ncbi:hypothetical protein [Thalassotalea maritima]|uniref:hypothetical protein n=1 Tax=Thalassotalea maritima TaxID=3242416 RepID=UPI003528F86E